MTGTSRVGAGLLSLALGRLMLFFLAGRLHVLILGQLILRRLLMLELAMLEDRGWRTLEQL